MQDKMQLPVNRLILGDNLESARNLSGVVCRTLLAACRADCLAVATGKNLGGDMLCWAAFFLETNGSETEGLVMRNRIEYRSKKHLGKNARKNTVVANYILHQRKPGCS